MDYDYATPIHPQAVEHCAAREMETAQRVNNHVMSAWVAVRYGKVSRCIKCGAELYDTGAGGDALDYRCGEVPKRSLISRLFGL